MTILQTIGSGCAFFDYDNDGWIDIYLVNSDGPSALYRNNRNGTFTEVTDQAGVANRSGYGVGCAVGDYDGDGWLDLYVTNYGPNVLYRNNGRWHVHQCDHAGGRGGGWLEHQRRLCRL